jgi:hypothetical protein
MSTPTPPESLLPWDPNFTPPKLDTSLLGQVTTTLGQVEKTAQDTVAGVVDELKTATGALSSGVGQATQIGSEVVGETAAAATTAAAEAAAAAAGAAQAVGEAVRALPPAGAPGTPAAPTSVPLGGLATTNILASVEKAALDAAKATTLTILPSLQKTIEARIAAKAQAEIQQVLEKIQGGEAAPAVPTLTDFAHADARSRAIRTFLIGIVLSVLWGLTNILGNIATVDWTNRNALPQVLTLVVGSAVSSIIAYVARLVQEPKHIQAATIIPGSTHH